MRRRRAHFRWSSCQRLLVSPWLGNPRMKEEEVKRRVSELVFVEYVLSHRHWPALQERSNWNGATSVHLRTNSTGGTTSVALLRRHFPFWDTKVDLSQVLFSTWSSSSLQSLCERTLRVFTAQRPLFSTLLLFYQDFSAWLKSCCTKDNRISQRRDAMTKRDHDRFCP